MEFAIEVSALSKAFPLELNEPGKLRYEFLEIMRNLTGISKPKQQLFWALQDISFCISKGESVAIIGRNGSGKTTLLRLLTRIMRPTQGTINIQGNYTALIGLGTGFNPQLTGKENIHLSAAIYGFKPHETTAIMEDIIAFADVGEFIDAKVNKYSSGMLARLGFSVAIHLLPEIVFVDEILSVGDEAFQHKCIIKLNEFKGEGRTLVFVSHSASTLQQLCDRALWIDKGVLRMDGGINEVIKAYQTYLKT